MKRAALLLSILTVLCSGCAAPQAVPPVFVPVAPCPAPAAPTLPIIDGENMFDTPTTVAALLERDSRLRRYIQGFKDALACYLAQTEGHYGME